MQAILKFNLDDFEDRENHKRALQGSNLFCAMREFSDEFLRYEIRKNPANTDEQIEIYEKVQNKFLEILAEWDINLYA